MKKISLFTFIIFNINLSFSQTIFDFFKVNDLLNDAVKYSENYITPATDAAIYQASSAWVNSAKKPKLWDVSIGIHGNVFFVPKRDRSFTVKNSDYNFFQLEQGNETNVPTAFGDNSQVYMTGTIYGNTIRIKTPEGINKENVSHPYLNVTIGMPYGLEIVTRTSAPTNLKNGSYFIYGYGIRYNVSQYFKNIEKKNIYFSIMPIFTREEFKLNFLEIPSNFGELGINRIVSKVNTYHVNFALSKSFKKLELLGVITSNYSEFKYDIKSIQSQETSFIPFSELANPYIDRLEEPKFNMVYEISSIYSFKNFSINSTVSFGKFISTNFGIQYNLLN